MAAPTRRIGSECTFTRKHARMYARMHALDRTRRSPSIPYCINTMQSHYWSILLCGEMSRYNLLLNLSTAARRADENENNIVCHDFQS